MLTWLIVVFTLETTGCFLAGGVATGNPAVRYAGLGLQEAGLAAKSAGEARKWEDTRMGDVRGWPLLGRLRPARPEPRGDELV